MLFQHMRTFIFDLRMDWEEAMWQASPERKELATQRLAAHILSTKEGRVSPYDGSQMRTQTTGFQKLNCA